MVWHIVQKKISSEVVDKKEVTVPWWRRTKFSTGHLEGLNWEVVVVDLNIKNAYVLPGGKIVVYKGILKHCKSDAQVATVIGHEVSPDYCPCFGSIGKYNTFFRKYKFRVVKTDR